MIVAVCITDGRTPPTIQSALESAKTQLEGIDEYIIIDDSANSSYAKWLDQTFESTTILHHPERRGLGGAVSSAWSVALTTPTDYVFHLEDDFVVTEPVSLIQATTIFIANPRLAQLSLKRQPVNEAEIHVGGYMEMTPGAYWDHNGYVGHDTTFTFNPSLIPRRVIECANDPTTPMLEQDVTERLLALNYYFGVLGQIADPPRVEHIGHTRSSGYRW